MSDRAKIILGDSRAMPELADAGVDLVVTSPPYWHLKDYGVKGQIGYGQSLHEYLRDLYCTWSECFRVLREGARLCLNIGDQFARSAVYGRYKVIPLHAEFIAQGEQIGFDFLGAIIWQKKTTMNTTGGANVMGSYPYPPNGIVELDYEFILIFKKPGETKKVAPEIKAASKLTKEEWKEYFAGHWYFGGVRQVGHEAMFPEELPRRLIKMFTFRGDTVLDPFLGSGTTAKVALELGRRTLGYEINERFLNIIEEKLPSFLDDIIIARRKQIAIERPEIDYIPNIQNAKPLADFYRKDYKLPDLSKVTEIVQEDLIRLDNGLLLKFLGIKVEKKAETIDYLTRQLLGKKILIKNRINRQDNGHDITLAYIYLKNRIFINAYLIKSGLASPDLSMGHKFARKFVSFSENRDMPTRLD